MGNWIRNLKQGEDGQKRWVEYVTKYSNDLKYVSTSKTKINDEIFKYRGRKKITFEIKTDYVAGVSSQLKSGLRISADTGNMYIEFSDRGKPSGISTTEADYYVVYFIHLQEFWLTPVEKLKQLISENKFRPEKGGDDFMAIGYLIARNEYRDYFTVLKNE